MTIKEANKLAKETANIIGLGESVDIKKMNKSAKEIADKLSAADKRFRNSVALSFDEGSFQFINNAFAAKQEEYWFIFTEHFGYFVFHESDVDVATYKRIY